MRKGWSRIILLCMACMISVSGLCLAGVADVPSSGPPNVSAGDDMPNRSANIRPGAVEFRPMGWDENGFVAIWRNPPGSLWGEYAIRIGDYIEGRRGTDSEGLNFDIEGWDDDGNPNEFLVCYSYGGTSAAYKCRVKIIDNTTVEIKWLESSYDEWKRKAENRAYEVPPPILEKQSPECPYPIEIYKLGRVNGIQMSSLERVNEEYPYLFQSQYGFYQRKDSWRQDPLIAGYLNHSFLGPMAEALIAFWEAGGEVEAFPADASDIVYVIGN